MTRLAIAIAIAIAVAVTACAPPSTKTAPTQETPAMAQTGPVTLEGKAENAKAGAILLTDDGQGIYIDKLENGWPDELHRKRVRVTGVLRNEKRIPDPQSNPHTAGAFGNQTILYDATWTVVP